MAHATEVALAFFADIGGEEDGGRWLDLRVLEAGGDGEESGQAGPVVGGAWAEELRVFFAGRTRGADGEDGVEVSGEKDDGVWGRKGFGSCAGASVIGVLRLRVTA